MERVKRRWWTWGVSLIALVVIAGAVLSGAFQLAVLTVPSYREQLADWVSGVAGRPVQIGGISLAWRGLAPRLELNDITLYSTDGSEELRLERLSLGIGLRRLLAGEFLPSHLEISGIRVTAEVDAQGRLRIAGFEPGETQQAAAHEQWLDGLERFEHVAIEGSELRIAHHAFGPTPLNVRIEALDLDKTASGFELAGELRLPADRGGVFTIEARIDGAVAQFSSWRGRFEANIQGLRPQGWLRPYLLPGTQILAQELEAHISGEIERGHIAHAHVELNTGALVLARAGVLSSALRSAAVFDYTRTPQGWHIDVTELDFDGESLLRGSVRYANADGVSAYDVDADRIDLTRLSPWSGIWRHAPDWVQKLARTGGVVEGLVLRWRDGAQGARWSARARLSGLALRADSRVGLAGVQGEFSADESGGRLHLVQAPLVVELPATLEEPLAFDAVDAELRWARAGDGWRIGSEAFGWRLASLAGSGRFELRLPQAEGASPVLDLAMDFAGENALDARRYMPRHWSDGLKTWLARGIVGARIPRAELRIRGPLADFPFDTRPTGEWRLDIDTADTVLNYAPDWPRITGLRAHLLFRGNSLVITADAGRIGSSRIVGAEVRFDDFHEHLLTVAGTVEGDLARHYDFLRDSPLRKPLRGLLDYTQARGAARVDLTLRIPLDHAQPVSVQGSVAIADGELRYANLSPVTGLRGTLAFTEHGVTAEALHGQFEDLPLTLRIDAQEGTYGVVRGRFPFAPRADGSGAAQFLPGFLRPALQGQSVWELALPLRDGDAALTLSSDLVGTAIELPAPLGKTMDAAAPVRVRITGGTPMRVDVGYAGRLGVSVAIAPDAESPARIAGLSARLGRDEAPPARVGGFVLDGRIGRFEPAAWLPLLVGARGDGAAGESLHLDAIDLDVDSLVWKGYALRPSRLRYRPTADGWLIDLAGEGALGRVHWQAGDANHLRVELDHLQADALPASTDDDSPPEQTAQATTASPLEPASWPTVDAVCERLIIGEVALGRAELVTAQVPGGQVLQRLQIGGGAVDLAASGAWRRIGGRSSGELRFTSEIRRIDALLAALGYAPNLAAERARFNGELRWLPASEGIRWEMAAGTIDVEAANGQLRAVRPGASRVLGLINFYALPRRLTLDFDDVVGRGLAFDGIKGRFTLAGGDATTDDLTIDGPSLRMDIRGRVGLLARDYDQRVTVYPDLSSGVTLGAALVGGPAVGALVLLAQELLDKPLDQVSQFSYHISGPWDNPKVERLETQILSEIR
ncbi:TIGR02099 family protein [Fontimonas thermophila]|uniref:TIGR02099 family protein n=1 Tax=Fontimonas thermophila TaxID=1076937 RepID=A0A1I2KBX9_9GAMM|nr:YhdP family protein [Fontimonas thermophila]SFF63809.1 TIGR02099 family protein [Fontimonas thermophila]